MAKQTSDRFTADLLGHPRGRPAKPNALTGAQRAQRFRDSRKLFPVTRNGNSCEVCAMSRTRDCGVCNG